MAAGSHGIKLPDEIEHRFCDTCIGVRTVVFRPVLNAGASQKNTWIMLLGHHYPGLIILQEHIVMRLILLYERILEIQSILLGGHHDVAHIGNVTHQQIGAHRVVGAVEIRRHSPLQILCLTHIDDCPG